ncbi:hypothetical protein L7F22_011367 [Adiantum nelumboides]|nr:hypothetical protein [Adiantum nelumboides]
MLRARACWRGLRFLGGVPSPSLRSCKLPRIQAVLCSPTKSPLPPLPLPFVRHFTSSPGGASSSVIAVKSDTEYLSALNLAQENNGLAVVYFTAKWCGPCTQLCMSTAFHPQIDGETERVNRILEDMLRMMTPFEAMYGYNCPTPINFLNSRNKVELSHEMLEKMDNELAKIRGNIREAQKRHKLYYDKKHRVVEYEIGDMVFLKVIPEKSHLILGKDRRLSPRFAGPFKILKRIGSLAYKLELPSHVKVHPVFHVSLLKKYVPNVHHVLQDNSKLKDDGTLSVEPDLVLDRRVKHLRNRDIVELLVKWQNYPVEDASWVDLSVLQSRMISPIVDELSTKYDKATFLKVDIDEEKLREVVSEEKITSVPTFRYFRGGKSVGEVIGADARSLKDKVAALCGH